MEELRNYARFLELEDSIPCLEVQKTELTEQVRDARLEYNWKDAELKNWENPGFFQRLFGKTEEKKEAVYLACREVKAIWEEAERDLAEVENRLETEKQEWQALSGSREAYENACREGSVTAEAAAAAFGPVAVQAASRCLEALEDARKWMQQDAVRKGVSEKNRKYEMLARAEDSAKRICQILEMIPSDLIPVGTYLKYPGSYITNVTSEFKQLDRLEEAERQVRACRDGIRSRI